MFDFASPDFGEKDLEVVVGDLEPLLELLEFFGIATDPRLIELAPLHVALVLQLLAVAVDGLNGNRELPLHLTEEGQQPIPGGGREIRPAHEQSDFGGVGRNLVGQLLVPLAALLASPQAALEFFRLVVEAVDRPEDAETLADPILGLLVEFGCMPLEQLSDSSALSSGAFVGFQKQLEQLGLF